MQQELSVVITLPLETALAYAKAIEEACPELAGILTTASSIKYLEHKMDKKLLKIFKEEGRVAAVREYRTLTGASLKEAVQAIAAIEHEARSPSNHQQPPGAAPWSSVSGTR